MAPRRIALSGADVIVTARPLEADAFAPYGDVIQNPRPGLHPSSFVDAGPLPSNSNAVAANQASAIKYLHVTRMVNDYGKAPSGRPGVAVVNMFVCAARTLQTWPAGSHNSTSTSTSTSTPASSVSRFFSLGILERHPYTTQTFSPLSTAGPRARPQDHRYLVIVAPNLGQGCEPGARRRSSSITDKDHDQTPDVTRLKAFLATTDQAVTYGAGVWHAPMVALGPEGSTVDYVVTQFANGVEGEDCEEVVLVSPGDGARVLVELPTVVRDPNHSQAE